MKLPLLPIILTLSLLANAGGIVFLCLFVSSQSHIKSLQKEKKQLVNNLWVNQSSQLNSVSSDNECTRYTFISHATGQPESFAVAPSTLRGPAKDMTLIVYLHGMGSSYMEPWERPTNEPIGPRLVSLDPNFVLISSDYGKIASWGNDEGISNLSQNIRELCEQFPVRKIIIMGTSMGGCVALSYASSAPPDVKSKITGVVSVEGAGDLAAVFNQTNSMEVKSALITAFGGDPTQRSSIYAAKSFLPNIGNLPPGVKVAVVTARNDRVVPPNLQVDLYNQLRSHNIPSKLIEVKMGHGTPPAAIYLEAFNFVR